MQTNRSRFVFQRPSADLARSHLTALRYSRARIVAPEIPMPRLDSSHSLKLHREAADAVRIMAAADSCQEAKGRAVQYARTACALKQEARKLERQAEQLLEDAAGERKKTKRYYNQMYSGREAVVSHRRMASREFAEKSKRQE